MRALLGTASHFCDVDVLTLQDLSKCARVFIMNIRQDEIGIPLPSEEGTPYEVQRTFT